jgi:cytochrome c-type biogenesis protein CcmH/NrfG
LIGRAYSGFAQSGVTDTNVKLLLIGGAVAVVVGVIVSYFSLAHFFAVNAKAKDVFAKNRRVAENASENAERTTLRAKKRGVGA